MTIPTVLLHAQENCIQWNAFAPYMLHGMHPSPVSVWYAAVTYTESED